MEKIKTYKFASLCIGLRSKFEIEDTEYYSKFLSTENPNIIVNVICDKLPTACGKELYKTEKQRLIEDNGQQFLYSSFYNQKIGRYADFACKVSKDACIDLYIDYNGLWDKMIFNALNVPQMLIESGSALMHCSVIEVNGKAFLFAGDSGAGKSTQANLWKIYRNAEVINGDRCAVGVDNGRCIAYGVPFCGTSGICENKISEIGAIFLPVKSKTNKLEKSDEATAFMNLIGKITYDTWSIDSIDRATDILKQIVEAVPVFRFECLPNESAVRVLEESYERYLSMHK